MWQGLRTITIWKNDNMARLRLQHSSLRTVSQTLKLLRPQELKVFVWLLVGRIFANLLDVAGVATIGLLATGGVSTALGQTEGNFLGIEVSSINDFGVANLLLVVLGFFTAKAGLATLLLRVTVNFLARVEIRASNTIAQSVFDGSIDDLKKYSRAELDWAIVHSTHVTFSGQLTALMTFLSEAVLLISILGLFISIDVVSALFISSYFIGIVLIFQVVVNRGLRKLGAEVADATVRTGSSILAMVDMFREMSTLGKNQYLLSQFAEARTKRAVAAASLRFLNSIPRYIVETALVAGALIFVSFQLLSSETTQSVATIGVFLAGGVRMMGSLLPLQAAFASLREQMEQVRMSQEVLISAQQSNGQKNPTSGPSAPTASGARIDLVNVVFSHSEEDAPALDNVSLTIEPGEFFAIIGPSGSGKSTLADILTGLRIPDSGLAEIDEKPASEVVKGQPSQIAYVPQKPGILPGSVLENIAFGEPPENIDWSRLENVLKSTALESVVGQLPNGINADLGKHLDNLSGGQLQRLGLARALYSKPRLLVLDEATSALDPETEAEVATFLESIRGGSTTMVVIAHRLSTVQRADRVMVLVGGRVEDIGSFRDIRTRVPLVREYIRLMSIEE